jgi:hypothetical protein
MTLTAENVSMCKNKKPFSSCIRQMSTYRSIGEPINSSQVTKLSVPSHEPFHEISHITVISRQHQAKGTHSCLKKQHSLIYGFSFEGLRHQVDYAKVQAKPLVKY